MNDQQFLKEFHNGTLSSEEFRHLGHLRLTWLVLRRHGLQEAIEKISSGIQQYAEARGASDMYNETLTQFWIRIVNHALQTNHSAQEFGQFINEFPILLNKQLPFNHWRPETLNGSSAKADWLDPDQEPLPF